MGTVRLGDRVRDEISGLEGIASARYEYLYGCVRVCVRPEKLKDGKPVESTVFDEAQLRVVKAGVVAPSHFPASSIALGDKVKDTITGYAGVVTGRFTSLHAHVQFGVQPQELKDGKPVESFTFDAGSLELVKPKKVEPIAKQTGGPRDNPSSPVR
jgi:hypothetical protein